MNGITLNEGFLGAIDSATRDQLVSFINSLSTPEQKQQLVNAMANVSTTVNTKNATSRTKLISRLYQISDAAIVNGVLSGELLPRDYEVFKAVTVAAATSYAKIFLPGDAIATGVTNLKGGELPKGQWMLVDRVALLYGVNATLADTAWQTDIADKEANGYMNMKQGGRTLLPDYFPTGMFANKQNANAMKGEVMLDNPFWLEPEVPIEANWFATAAAAANANIKICLRGSMIVPR